MSAWGAVVRPWRPLYLGDDLYCHQPLCEQVLAHGGGFLFVCLPPSHTLLYEWIADFERTGDLQVRTKTRWTGTRRLTETYRWINTVPLRDGHDALMVNWCELTTTNAKGEVLYSNAWATLTHSILDHCDALYQRVRRQRPSRRTFFEPLRALTQYMVCATWEELFEFMLKVLETAQPPPRRCSQR